MRKFKQTVNPKFIIGEATDTMYGDFKQVNGFGMEFYDPGHTLADKSGFRTDYIELFKEFDLGILRFPGGSNMATYRWRDGVGQLKDRPRRPNIFIPGDTDNNVLGINEMFQFAKLIGAKTMLNVAMGYSTGDIPDAMDELSYCLDHKGSLAELRRLHGFSEPHQVDFVCLGNEEDGNWEYAQNSPESYGRKARETAKLFKTLAPEVKLILAGTSNPAVATFPEWDRKVLDLAYDYIDWIDLHYIRCLNPSMPMGVAEPPMGVEDLPWLPVEFGNFIDTTDAAIRYIKGKHASSKDVKICINEWAFVGVPDEIPQDLHWTEIAQFTEEDKAMFTPEAVEFSFSPMSKPGTLIEAVLAGANYITMLKRADRVVSTTGHMGFTVNIGKEGLLKAPAYYTAEAFSHYARGHVLRSAEEENPMQKTKRWGEAPGVQSVTVYSEKRGEISVFAVNLSLREEFSFETALEGFGKVTFIEHIRMWDEQPLAGNSYINPSRIVPHIVLEKDEPTLFLLPPLSFHIFRYQAVPLRKEKK